MDMTRMIDFLDCVYQQEFDSNHKAYPYYLPYDVAVQDVSIAIHGIQELIDMGVDLI